MILIIEGADLVGKSTLAQRIASANRWPIVKIRGAAWRRDPKAETWTMATTTIAILRAVQPDVIFDRMYFSWWAYAPVLGYEVAYMPTLIGEFIHVSDARLILLTASEATIRQRFGRKPDLYYSLDEILAANARYPSLLPLLPETLPRLHIDTTNISADDTYQQAEAFLHR